MFGGPFLALRQCCKGHLALRGHYRLVLRVWFQCRTKGVWWLFMQVDMENVLQNGKGWRDIYSFGDLTCK